MRRAFSQPKKVASMLGRTRRNRKVSLSECELSPKKARPSACTSPRVWMVVLPSGVRSTMPVDSKLMILRSLKSPVLTMM